MQKQGKSRFCSGVSLTKKQIDFLDRLSRHCRYSGGKKLSKAEIIRALINVMGNLEIDVKAVKSEEQLKDRVIQAFCKHK